jgi:hypothetical protein
MTSLGPPGFSSEKKPLPLSVPEKKELTEQQKTRLQEKSYHVLFGQIADHCVATGIDLPMAMEKISNYEVAVTKEFVKQTWRAILKAQTGKESTTEQTKEDVKNVQRDFAELWLSITKETINWPSVENRHLEEWYGNEQA